MSHLEYHYFLVIAVHWRYHSGLPREPNFSAFCSYWSEERFLDGVLRVVYQDLVLLFERPFGFRTSTAVLYRPGSRMKKGWLRSYNPSKIVMKQSFGFKIASSL